MNICWFLIFWFCIVTNLILTFICSFLNQTIHMKVTSVHFSHYILSWLRSIFCDVILFSLQILLFRFLISFFDFVLFCMLAIYFLLPFSKLCLKLVKYFLISYSSLWLPDNYIDIFVNLSNIIKFKKREAELSLKSVKFSHNLLFCFRWFKQPYLSCVLNTCLF